MHDDAQLCSAGVDHLEVDNDNDKAIEAINRKVTAILRSHVGLFLPVRLSSSLVSNLRAWLQIMATKGMEEPVTLNCEWLEAMIFLSVQLLRYESTKQLHLALSQMSCLTVPCRLEHFCSVHFPNLQQLVLLEGEIGDFLGGCPVLEMLAFMDGCGVP